MILVMCLRHYVANNQRYFFSKLISSKLSVHQLQFRISRWAADICITSLKLNFLMVGRATPPELDVNKRISEGFFLNYA